MSSRLRGEGSAFLRVLCDLRGSKKGSAKFPKALAISAGLILLFGACTRNTPTPAPIPTATPTTTPQPAALYIPLVQVASRATATPPPPSGDATPTPSDAAPSPTPSPTPFPPGPPSKLGLFVSRNDPTLFDLLRTGNVAVVKTLEYDPNFVAEIKRISPQTLVIARLASLTPPDFATWDPLAAAREFTNAVLGIMNDPVRRANIDAWEAYNEPAPADETQMAALAQFEAERTRLLADAGIRSCVGNFSAGQPPLEWWPAFFPALQAVRDHNGYLCLHEYSAPYLWFGSGPHQNQPGSDEGDSGWLTLRYRKVYRQYLEPAGLAVPLIITETGVDGLVTNRPGPADADGWQEFIPFWTNEGRVTTTGAGFYVEQLAWYDAELARDPYVAGAAVFALVAQEGWQSYELIGPAADILKQYLAVHPPRQ